ncbi:MAG TPA: 2-oxo acid dehydrogenase subunit E2 [Ignavibacteriaceae bacterium]
MATEFKLPELGENIESADVINVLIKSGDSIDIDQGIIEIETDKATIEVPSTMKGVVKDVKVKAGEKVKVGQVIFTFEDGKEQTAKIVEKAAPEKKEPRKEKPAVVEEVKSKGIEKAVPEKKKETGKKIVEFKLPELGENIESADIIKVLVSKGDKLEQDQGILEIETDKATIEVPSDISGIVIDVLVKEGEKANVGQSIIKVETGAAEPEPEKNIPETDTLKEEAPLKQLPEEKKESGGKRAEFRPGEVDEQPPIMTNAAPAAPSVRRIARELGIDINKVKGSGSNGRISMDDVKAFVKSINEELLSKGAGIGLRQEALPDFTRYGAVERKPMSKIRTKTAEHLSYAWAVTPHVTQFDKADITNLEKLRKDFNPGLEKSGGKLTVTSILVKVITAAIKEFPQFNSSIDMEKNEIIYKQYFNIGIAVDTENGLLVPVIKNADKKSLKEISIELNQLAEKARTRKITPEEMQGGCITITNLGGIGGTSFTPIVNSPEVAILGVSRGEILPVYKETRLVPRLMLPLSLSYDHRIIDGADAARFLRWVCEVLEQPLKMLM